MVDIYAQRIDGNGNILWGADCIVICNAENWQFSSRVISDGSGGAIITWQDCRKGTDHDIYALRIDSSGNFLWALNGIPICDTIGDQIVPFSIEDGSGGAIVVWCDQRDTELRVYAQRIDGNGNSLWEKNGISLCDTTGERYSQSIISDGSGGAIITWCDFRYGERDIFVQRIDSSGNKLWNENGVPVCVGPWEKYWVGAISDSSGGVIIVWQDLRKGTDWDIYAQRIDSIGNQLWGENGIPISDTFFNQEHPLLVSDGSGGGIIVWDDSVSGNLNIMAQRIDGGGNKLWGNGVQITDTIFNEAFPNICLVDSSVIIVYNIGYYDYFDDLMAQKIDFDGNCLWKHNGVVICNADDSQVNPSLISDGSGGAIIVWEDFRGPFESKSDIYAQRVYANGQVGIKEKDELNIPSNIFIGSLSVKGYEDEKVVVYNIEGIKCGEYYGRNIGYDLKPAVYFMKLRGRFYKIIKIGG